MCGIIAIFGPNAHQWATHMPLMLNRLAHRGPDDHGTYVDNNIVLGQTRLSIVDVAGGRQPIFSEDGGKCIICNGEIYNHLELRNSLCHQHRFSTNSDTEAILHIFEEEGQVWLRGQNTRSEIRRQRDNQNETRQYRATPLPNNRHGYLSR